MGKDDYTFKVKGAVYMAEDKQPHEKLADKELDLKAAQEVHLQDDFKKADKAGENQNDKDDKQSNDK